MALDMTFDFTVRDNIFPGLDVKIRTSEKKTVEGIVKEVLTIVAYDPNGIYVELESGECGNIIEVIQTKSEIQTNQIIIQLQKDLRSDEGQYIEFKETFAYPTKSTAKNITPDASRKFDVAKAVAAFANAEGGTLYIGIKDRVRIPVGLDPDFSLLRKDHQDCDSLEIDIKQNLRHFFNRENDIFRSIQIRFVKFRGKDVCVIQVEPSVLPFCLTSSHTGHTIDYFYVRIGNSSELYTANKFVDYCLKRRHQYNQSFVESML